MAPFANDNRLDRSPFTTLISETYNSRYFHDSSKFSNNSCRYSGVQRPLTVILAVTSLNGLSSTHPLNVNNFKKSEVEESALYQTINCYKKHVL